MCSARAGAGIRLTCLAEQADLRAVEGHVVTVGDDPDAHASLMQQQHCPAQLRAREGEEAELEAGSGGQQGAQQAAQRALGVGQAAPAAREGRRRPRVRGLQQGLGAGHLRREEEHFALWPPLPPQPPGP